MAAGRTAFKNRKKERRSCEQAFSENNVHAFYVVVVPVGVALNSHIVVPPNLVITTGVIDVPSGTGAITDGKITTPQDLNFNGGNGATLISNTPLNATGDANINGGTLDLQNNLTTGGNVNVNPGASLVVDPTGSVNAGGDVNVTDATVISSGQLDSQGSLNLNPGASLEVDPTGSVNAGGFRTCGYRDRADSICNAN
jgi:hypothetical protein